MAQNKPKINLKEVFTRNLLLFIFIHFITDCSNNMINAFINMNAKAAGISAAAIGVAASAYAVASLIMRMPAGGMTKTNQKRLLIIGVILVRYLSSFLLGTLGTTSGTMYIVCRTFNGLAWSACGVVIPAIEACLMDKRAMGTIFAVYVGVSGLAKNLVRALGVTIYQGQGVVMALVVAGIFALVGVVLVFFMDFGDEKLQNVKTRGGKGGLLANVNFAYMPICFLMGLSNITWNINNQFDNVLAQERGIDIASILVITGVLASAWGFIGSTLCDFIKPKYVLCLSYASLGVGAFMLATANDYNAFLIAQILVTIGVGYSKIQNVYLFKNCPAQERGAVHATNYFVTDIFSLFAGAFIGLLIENLGYANAYHICSAFVLVTAVTVFLFGDKLMAIASAKSEAKIAEAE